MKAANINSTGGPDKIQWSELHIPEINQNQVLVKVASVAANPVDTYIRAGKFPLEKPLPMPYIIGSDMVGIVSKVGKDVKQFKVGQKVWSNTCGYFGRQGCFAEFVAVDENLLYSVPDGIKDQELVATAQAGITACYGLLHIAKLQANDTIFVLGGSGNVGSAVIQIAKARGAKVFAATSGEAKMEWCRKLGADLVVDYKKDNIEKKVKEVLPQGVNVFWDTSRQPNFDTSVAMMANRGRIILMAGADSRPQFPVGPFYRKQCTLAGFSLFNATPAELRQCAEIVTACLQQNKLKTKIAATLPLEEAAKAHEMLESQADLWGKIVLVH